MLQLFRQGAMVAAAVLLFAGAAGAQTFDTTLNTLLEGGANSGGITLGDKRYYNFTFSSAGNAPVAANGVDVNLTSTDSGNHYQLRFTFRADLLDATPGQTTDVVIGYRIDVLGNQLINRVGLGFNSTVTGTTGGDAASVVESVRTVDGSDVSPSFPGQDQVNISVFNDGSGGFPDNSSFSLPVHPTRSLEFDKDILVSSRPNGGSVNITIVDNIVDQVPEPASAAVLGLAGSLLLMRRKRA